jgi:hypothetical protein
MLGITLRAVVDLKNHMVSVIANQDKYLHFITFLSLIFIGTSLFKKSSLVIITGLLFLFGVILELLQELLSNGMRHFHWLDILFNALGMLTALLMLFVFRKIRTKNLSDSN